MKILIIALARTGSTTLLNKLAKENNLTAIMEPQQKEEFREDEDGIVVKCILWKIPKDDSWFNELIKKFDEVILLSRRNLKELVESLSYLKYNKDKGFDFDMEYLWEMTPNYPEMEKLVNENNDELIKLSKSIGVEVTYYEDLYKDSINGKLRLGNLEKRTLI